MSKYTIDEKEIKLCPGTECANRYRCYRHSLYNDANQKRVVFNYINVDDCLNPEEGSSPFKDMWIPSNIPDY